MYVPWVDHLAAKQVVRTSACGYLNWAGSISFVRTFQEIASGLLRFFFFFFFFLSTLGIELTLRH